MKWQQWEPTIQQMVDECNRETKEAGKYKVLTAWRARLAAEPHRLQPFQIDEIVRKVRDRFMNGTPAPVAHMAVNTVNNPVARPHYMGSAPVESGIETHRFNTIE